jgi:hypothetical protein
MDELISDRAKYLALALLGLISISGAMLLADGSPGKPVPAATVQTAKPAKVAQAVSEPAPEMAPEPEVEASPVSPAAPAAVPAGQDRTEQGEAAVQEGGWGGSE